MDVARKAIESQYKGVCTITEYKPVKDPITHQTSRKEVAFLIEQPCRLSFETITSTTTDAQAQVTQKAKLFISPEIVIPAGSKLTVIQNYKTGVYKQSGVPAFYNTHQEIILDIFERFA